MTSLKTETNKELAKKLQQCVNSLVNDMRDMNPLELKISEYNQRYLGDHLRNLSADLEMYAHILGKSLASHTKPLSNICLIEYGGGTGFMSLLAKRSGIGTVIYNDIYDVSCKDAREIARILGCQPDYYVKGDIDDLVSFCNEHQLKCDNMVSYDVIEHIYDIDDFLRKLRLVSHQNTAMLHASGCNMFYYPYVRATSQNQLKAEAQGSQRVWGSKERDCLSSFHGERIKIIKKHFPDLRDEEVERLAHATRGLIEKDIIDAVSKYKASGQLPVSIEHPTNTCDPYTGNWSEHLMNPYYLAETLESAGFKAKVLPLPRLKSSASSRQKLSANLHNFMTHVSGESLYFSRGYALYAQYHGNPLEETHRQHIYKYSYSIPWWYSTLPLYKIFFRLDDLYTGFSKRSLKK